MHGGLLMCTTAPELLYLETDRPREAAPKGQLYIIITFSCGIVIFYRGHEVVEFSRTLSNPAM